MPCPDCGSGDLRPCPPTCQSEKARTERQIVQDRKDKLQLADIYLVFSRCKNCSRLTVKAYCCPFCGEG